MLNIVKCTWEQALEALILSIALWRNTGRMHSSHAGKIFREIRLSLNFKEFESSDVIYYETMIRLMSITSQDIADYDIMVVMNHE